VGKLETVRALVEAESTLALSTSGKDGTPAVAPLFYLAGEGLRLYWFSSPSSRHSRNLRANPSAAVAIYHSTEEWKEIRGVQMRGEVSVVGDRERRKAVERAYAERFRLGRGFEAAFARTRLYVFEPSWIRYIDNSKRFGFKFELRPARGAILGS
jgi:uncharacterized protein YhbP (UPF0306 family)